MNRTRLGRSLWALCAGALLAALAWSPRGCPGGPLPLPPATTNGQATTAPVTEERFPPLRVPAGFRATLFACDPLIEYPSAIAIGPRPRSLFVAIDYMTGLGT